MKKSGGNKVKLLAGVALLGLLLLLCIWHKQTYQVLPKVPEKGLQEVSQGTEEYHPLEYTEEDLYYMTEAIYFEARSEPIHCQILIGHVIMTRVYWHSFPNTVKEVVWQSAQFSYTHDGKHERMTDKNAKKVAETLAKLVLGGYHTDSLGAAWYFNPDLADPDWQYDYEFVESCGGHDFYISKNGKEYW